MKDSTYYLLASGLDAFLWGGELLGDENLPETGPAIIISNHLGPLGPIGVISSLPFRLYPWVAGQMIDPDLASDYIRQDFIEPRLKMYPPLSIKFSRLLTKLTIPLFQSLGGIPAYVGGKELIYKTLEISLELLHEKKCILVFPEYAVLGTDSMKNIYPFQKTVFRLGEMYFLSTKKRLGFYPIAVHHSRKIKVGSPYFFSHISNPARERVRLKNLLEDSVIRMYQEMDQEDRIAKYLTPRTN